MSSNSDLEKAQAEIGAQNAALQVLRKGVVDTAYRTTARARARLEAYNKIYENYEKYIIRQAESLASGALGDSPKELGVAKLIAIYLTESDQFLKEVEPLLAGAEKVVRKSFIDQSFEHLAEPVKEKILAEFNRKKQELLVWLVGEIQRAQAGVVGEAEVVE